MTLEEDPLLTRRAKHSRSSHLSKKPSYKLPHGPAAPSAAAPARSHRSFPSLHTLTMDPFLPGMLADSSKKRKKRALDDTTAAAKPVSLHEPTAEEQHANHFIFDIASLKKAMALLEQHQGSFEAHHTEYFNRLFRLKFSAHTYGQWYLQVQSGYHLIFYGYGAKEKAIARWLAWTQATAKYRVLVLDGCNESLSLELVCHRLAKAIHLVPSTKRKTDRVGELLEALEREKMAKDWRRWLLVIHNLDGPVTRSDAFQSFFHRLAQKKELCSFVCTIEHIHACLLFSPNYFPPSRSQTLFIDCTTMVRYSATSLHMALRLSGVAGAGSAPHGHLGSISAVTAITVLTNLTSHARKVYALLARWQLSWDREATQDEHEQQTAHRLGTPVKGSVPSLSTLVASPGTVSSASAQTMLSPKSPATAAYATEPQSQTMDPSIGLTFEQLYQMARENFLATHESSFRALLNEFTDHALIVMRRSVPTAAAMPVLSPLATTTAAAASAITVTQEPLTERLSSPLSYAALRSVLAAIEQLQ